jgi:hypothetical protein
LRITKKIKIECTLFKIIFQYFFEEAKRNYIKTTAQAQAVPENIVQ